MAELDIVIVTDLRFPGGSSSSTLEEIRANSEAGIKTGLYHLPASVLKRPRPFHPGILAEIVKGSAKLLNVDDNDHHARLVAYRHPSVIPVHEDAYPKIRAEHLILIVNHPPINSRGRIDYILPHAQNTIENIHGRPAQIYPIGPLIRSELRRVYRDTVKLADDDWLNIFDIGRFFTDRTPPSGKIRIGRHSRPGQEKWPATREDILNAYPDSADIGVAILGGTKSPEAILGYRPPNWEVHEFGSMLPEEFLRTIDVFVYFHHPSWTEAFGRVIVEAMASGLPIIVPPHFRPLLQDAAIYTEPSGVRDAIEQLHNSEEYASLSRRAREYAASKFSRRTHLKRLEKFNIRARAIQEHEK